MQSVRFIGAAHRSVFEIVEQLADHQLDFADNDGVGMFECFLRHEARMHTAHDHGHALGAELVGDFVAAVDVARHGGNADHVGLQIEVDRLDILVGEHDFVLVARNDRGNCQQARQRGVKRPVHI